MTLRISAVAWWWSAALGLLVGCSPAGNAIEQDLPATPSAPPSEKPASPSTAELPPGHPSFGPAATEPKPGEAPSASPAEGSHTMTLGDKLTMTAPDSWIIKRPGNGMISQEFALPAAKGDPRDGRLTVSSAGGSVQANIDRWAGQFSHPAGSKTADKPMTVEKKTLAGREVNLVDISGTYQESAGMMQTPTERPDYRMLAAIIPADGTSFFIKFYGPKKTVGEHEKEFRAMLDGLKPAK
jgi:hypothetical protein